MTLLEGLTLLIAAAGVFFIVVSSIGIVRMPDVYTRVHAVGKAGTLGIVGVLLAVGVYQFATLSVVFEMLALIGFFFLTQPVAAHMLDRAAFLTGVQPTPGTAPNDLADRYDPETRQLE
jgi:multicomponent Na+:H+ antiporter subunit G